MTQKVMLLIYKQQYFFFFQYSEGHFHNYMYFFITSKVSHI